MGSRAALEKLLTARIRLLAHGHEKRRLRDAGTELSGCGESSEVERSSKILQGTDWKCPLGGREVSELIDGCL